MKKHLKRRTFILMCLIAVLTLGLIAPAGISLPGISAEYVSAASKTTRADVNMRKSYNTKSDVITVLPANLTEEISDGFTKNTSMATTVQLRPIPPGIQPHRLQPVTRSSVFTLLPKT